MLLQWKELEPGVWGTSTPNGSDFIIEEVSDPATGDRLYEASQLLRTCCSTFQNRLKRFESHQEATQFIENYQGEQSGVEGN